MLSRFHLIPERYGQTDGRTDGRTDKIAISISRVSVLMRDKNKMAVYLEQGQQRLKVSKLDGPVKSGLQ